ncbi:GSCFA domain-containing protein [Aquimarina agarilytica]|uniref:GSCFA domain-containing protein n=1 Tax=Aquimarina agarilytica TaxID=1087449 RepID=UPI000289C598|nr:GSCFA domain-containing protein [Aquimarina agarilytica]
MQPFFLTLPPKQQSPSIGYTSKLFLMGSCFVENIGAQLNYHKFQNLVNPFGIIFHPHAIYNLLERVVTQRLYTEKDIFYHNEQWHSFEVHSQLSNENKDLLLDQLNEQLTQTHQWITQTSHIVITYGTAWGYEHEQHIVANCHKIPQKEFDKKLSSVPELNRCIKNTLNLIKSINNTATIIFTVSPVRHIKDGIIENNQSKSHLITAIHQTIEFNNKTSYYPAYELMLDCLRDYRFYKPDLIHPNDTAIEFIWEHFKQTWLYESDTQKTIKQVSEIQRGLQHKAFNPNSEAHKKFMASLSDKIKKLTTQFPFIKF